MSGSRCAGSLCFEVWLVVGVVVGSVAAERERRRLSCEAVWDGN